MLVPGAAVLVSCSDVLGFMLVLGPFMLLFRHFPVILVLGIFCIFAGLVCSSFLCGCFCYGFVSVSCFVFVFTVLFLILFVLTITTIIITSSISIIVMIDNIVSLLALLF